MHYNKQTREVDITGLDKAEVLAALYNASKPQGLGFLHYEPEPMSKKEAQLLLDENILYFDYLKGRVMKIDMTAPNNLLNVALYDRDNGQGHAKRVIDGIRK